MVQQHLRDLPLHAKLLGMPVIARPARLVTARGVALLTVESSVPDPWHFGTDPDPWIRTLDLRIRIWLRILLFSDSKMPTQNKFFSNVFCLLLSVGTFTSVFKDKCQ
jgi:hypothetical protein